MTRGTRALALLPAAALALTLLTACGGHSAASPPPASPSASDLAHMRHLVDEAASAAATADSDTATDH